MNHRHTLPNLRSTHRRGQRGAVLIISLIVLVVMLISAAALMRSFDISLTTAGNLAFKRDLAQQSEQAAETILARFRAGGALTGAAAREANAPTLNYSATVLPSNPQGIPNTLLANDATFAGAWTDADINAGQGITLRYVVDRMCATAGTGSETPDNCAVADASLQPGGSASEWQRAERASVGGARGAVAQPVVYRLTIRATGPRNTQSFFQSTFSCCGS
ncbi:pilus assembly PilX family protein [Methylibium sp.]|jgi:Tfp pilus assembly protein PilX|uniref:pilus assembly PilX family protein n=1 Tax=Methylibium sp. TaxID=2067992 RepID=UPI003D0F8FB5